MGRNRRRAGLGRGVRYVVVSSAADGRARARGGANKYLGVRMSDTQKCGQYPVIQGRRRGERRRQRPPAGATYLVASAAPPRPSPLDPHHHESVVVAAALLRHLGPVSLYR